MVDRMILSLCMGRGSGGTMVLVGREMEVTYSILMGNSEGCRRRRGTDTDELFRYVWSGNLGEGV